MVLQYCGTSLAMIVHLFLVFKSELFNLYSHFFGLFRSDNTCHEEMVLLQLKVFELLELLQLTSKFFITATSSTF